MLFDDTEWHNDLMNGVQVVGGSNPLTPTSRSGLHNPSESVVLFLTAAPL